MITESPLKRASMIVGIVAAAVAIAATIWGFVSGPGTALVPVAVESETGQRLVGVVFELNDGTYTKPTNGKGVTEIGPTFVETEATALWAVDYRKIGPVVFRPVRGGSLVKVVLAGVPTETK